MCRDVQSLEMANADFYFGWIDKRLKALVKKWPSFKKRRSVSKSFCGNFQLDLFQPTATKSTAGELSATTTTDPSGGWNRPSGNRVGRTRRTTRPRSAARLRRRPTGPRARSGSATRSSFGRKSPAPKIRSGSSRSRRCTPSWWPSPRPVTCTSGGGAT